MNNILPGGAPGARTLNQRIKSLERVSSPEFMDVHCAGQTARAYSDERGRTAVNCNPNCNPVEAGGLPSCRIEHARCGFGLWVSPRLHHRGRPHDPYCVVRFPKATLSQPSAMSIRRIAYTAMNTTRTHTVAS